MSTATESRIRVTCPCGKKYMVNSSLAGKSGKCKCGQRFKIPKVKERREVEQATSVDIQSRAYSASVDHEAAIPWWRDFENQVVGIVCLIAVLVAGIFQTQLNGPDFLRFYFMVGAVCCCGILLARFTSRAVVVFVMIVLAYEAIGAIRYGYGVAHGMHRFSTLGQMMLLGPFAIVALPFMDHFQSGSGGGSSNSFMSSCGSSCGGGCGGGGCGGCGG